MRHMYSVRAREKKEKRYVTVVGDGKRKLMIKKKRGKLMFPRSTPFKCSLGQYESVQGLPQLFSIPFTLHVLAFLDDHALARSRHTYSCLGRRRGQEPRWCGPHTASSESVKACLATWGAPGTAKIDSRMRIRRQKINDNSRLNDSKEIFLQLFHFFFFSSS